MHAPVSRHSRADLQDPSTSPAENFSPTKKQRDKFSRYKWARDVRADAVSAAVKVLAAGIAEFVDAETGEAYPSTRTLAEVCGYSEKWVRNTIPMLANTGWMDVELGSRGRGEKHCNRFRIKPEKRTPCTLLAKPEKRTPAGDQDAAKAYFPPLKADPVYAEPSNHKKESIDRVPVTTTTASCGETARTARVERVDVTETGSTTNTETARLEARSMELEEDQSVIETPEGPLELPGMRSVSCNAAPHLDAAADAPANATRSHLDLDEAAADAHVTSHNDNSEAAMFIDATNGFPQAGRKPREVGPAQIAERRKFFDKLLAGYPNQPAHEAADVDALIARMLTDRKSFVPFVDMIQRLKREVRTGRTDLPTLKNCLLRNWRAVHHVGAPIVRMAA
jgi:hypothetical protein